MRERGQALLEYILLSCLLSIALLGASGSLQKAWDNFYKQTSITISLPFF